MVHGAGAAQALLRTGQLDEMELHVVPVLLGAGATTVRQPAAGHVELELLRQLAPDAADPGQHITHLCYRIRRP